MGDLWVTSDHHLGHKNILNFTLPNSKIKARRYQDLDETYDTYDFRDLDDMHELMLYRWNSCVKPGDKVKHLGDFAMCPIAAEWFLKRAHGRKSLILGNHDHLFDQRIRKVYDAHFKKVTAWWKTGNYSERIIFSHFPLRYAGAFNVHGHVHNNTIKGPDAHRYMNVCVEVTNYFPIHIDECIERARIMRLTDESGEDKAEAGELVLCED